jgi:hypothetical protein
MKFTYDNAGTDSNEGVEIAGLAGTNVTGWKIIHNRLMGKLYSIALSGVIPNQLNGYALSVAIQDFKTVLLMV